MLKLKTVFIKLIYIKTIKQIYNKDYIKIKQSQ